MALKSYTSNFWEHSFILFEIIQNVVNWNIIVGQKKKNKLQRIKLIFIFSKVATKFVNYMLGMANI